MDIVLAIAGVVVTMLALAGMVLLVPGGAEPAIDSESNLSLATKEYAEQAGVVPRPTPEPAG